MPAKLELALPARYRAAEILAYHGRDALSVSERVAGAVIVKPLRLGGEPVLFEIDLSAGDVAILRTDRDLEALEEAQALHVAGRMLGLASDPDGFERLVAADPRVAGLVGMRTGLRIPLTADPWEAVCWAVIGQQINLTFAAALRRALIERAGVVHGRQGLHLHPTPAQVAELDPAELATMRFSRSKASYLVGAARSIAQGELDIAAISALPAGEAEAALVALRGIGPWTARYILLRGFGSPDVAPVGDSGLATGLQRLFGLAERPDIAAQEAAMAVFAPHRSLATAHLWASLTSLSAPSSPPPSG
ncbi:DNA repair protein [Kaistia algarum]|uniref:DNA-3-methyladenine glycosylase family protein n=1 Tax=Kaistia algarum TaxID=2083279 RepID=UPI000CE7B130|nr:DNA-3-methyladenine glycosylase [Kaistia algarum]MCX5514555.1 DNA-3-methyladenine glycosylase [Kaistia algarum]PPE77576.1 DNA repair protein [Kaistia algarum]